MKTILFEVAVISLVYFLGYRVGFHFGAMKALKDVSKSLDRIKDKMLKQEIKEKCVYGKEDRNAD